jgi:hypothetical protein
MTLRPFFGYYGGKWRAAPHYPAPAEGTIVEPFAGSAGYSVRYPDHQVMLYDVNEKVIGTWQYLIKVSADEIRSLPDVGPTDHVDDLAIPQEARWLIGWWLNKGTTAPGKTPSRWVREPLPGRPGTYWGRGVRERIARQVEHIRHWQAFHASYVDAPDVPATWFVDPPYSGAPGRRYTHSTVDYHALGEWCRSRSGQVVVCENVGADWLPFEPFMVAKASAGKGRAGVSKEAIWTGETMTATTVDACTHPTEASSTLKDGDLYCTACQTRFDPPANAPAPTEPAIPARTWGDEPDPLPVVPTILVASTDPYVNADGEGARQYAPKPALAAAKDAFAGGWRYEFTYAAAAVPTRGEPGKRGYKPAHVLHTIALRLARDTDSMTYDADGPIMIAERGYAIWAREDEIAEPVVEGKWAYHSAYISGRAYGARELRARLLRHGRELLNDPPAEAPAPARAESTPVPIAPVVPGTWGALHVGDTITGNDGAPYTVRSIESTGAWLAAGVPEVLVAIDVHGEQRIIRQPANAPITPADHGDHADAVEALDAIAAAGMSVQIIKESAPVPDQFSAPAPAPASLTRLDPPMGKYRWYKLPHPITGDPEAIWPRVSTIMKTHADSDGLTDWQIRMAMKGLSVSPDLIAMVASLDIENDKSKFREAAEQASNRASSKSGANFGTAVDRFTERLDGGETITSMGVPEGLRADVEAYGATLRAHGLEVLPQFTQRTTVNATYEYAGTWDRVVRRVSDGAMFKLDVKRTKPDARTGRMSGYSWLEYVSQLAAYVNGEFMCTLDFAGYEPMPEVSKSKGLILHIVPGQGRGELYGVRLEDGWRNFTRSIQTRKDRSEARTGWSWLIERPTAPAPAPAVEAPVPAAQPSALVALVEQEASAVPTIMPAVHDLVAADIAAATTVEQLGEIARNAIAAGVWTDALGALALGRDDEITARTAPDQATLAAIWAKLSPAGRWTAEVAAHADARAAELAQAVAA